MIRVRIVRENDYIKQITLKGHADYEVYGKDIVCAAVSATYLCSVNGILSIDQDSIKVTSTGDIQIIDVLKEDDTIEKLLCNMEQCLKSLEQQYPNNINVQ